MSNRKGNQKKQGQKHQNKVAFKIKFDEAGIKMQQTAPLDHLCPRCIQQIKWKLQYNKYKKQTAVSRCNKCEQKSIFKSYRTICDPCSNKYKLCAKCLTEFTEIPDESQFKKEKPGVEQDLLIQMKEYLSQFKERSRRKIMRLIKLKKVTWDRKLKCFIDCESQKEVEDLQIKNTYNSVGLEGDLEDGDSEDAEFSEQNEAEGDIATDPKKQDKKEVHKSKDSQKNKPIPKKGEESKQAAENDGEEEEENEKGENDLDDADDDQDDLDEIDNDLQEFIDTTQTGANQEPNKQESIENPQQEKKKE